MKLRSLPAILLGGTGGGGWMHQKGANSKAVSWLRITNTLVGSGWATSRLLCTEQADKTVWPHTAPISTQEAFLSLDEQLPAEIRDYCKFINGWVWVLLYLLTHYPISPKLHTCSYNHPLHVHDSNHTHPLMTLHPPTSSYPALSAETEPISKDHCRMWHHKMKVSCWLHEVGRGGIHQAIMLGIYCLTNF